MKNKINYFIFISIMLGLYKWVILSSHREPPVGMSKTLPISVGGPLQEVKSSPQETGKRLQKPDCHLEGGAALLKVNLKFPQFHFKESSHPTRNR